jgi:hypothetical protein
VFVLADVGGRNLDEAVKRMMNFLVKNNLSIKFNFVGRNGKEAFGTTQLFEVLYRKYKNGFKCKETV